MWTAPRALLPVHELEQALQADDAGAKRPHNGQLIDRIVAVAGAAQAAGVLIDDAIGMSLAAYQREGILQREPPLQAVTALLGPILVGGLAGNQGTDLVLPRPEPASYMCRSLTGRAAG